MFEVTEDQQKQISKWVKRIQKKHGDYYGAIGGGVTYMFTPTGLGVVLEVKESKTGETLNVTDYDNW